MIGKWMKFGIVAAVVVAIGLFAIGSAYAQGPGGYGMGMGGRGNSLIAVAAETLGMEQTELVAELTTTEGKTIADVAKEKGVALEKIVDAFVASHVTTMQTAVAAGRMTQDQADAMLAQMKANVTVRLNTPFTPGIYGGMGDCMTDDGSYLGGMGMGMKDGAGWMNGHHGRR